MIYQMREHVSVVPMTQLSQDTPDNTWYGLDVAQALSRLETTESGLTPEEAAARLQRYGANEIEFRNTPAWVRMLRQFNDPMVIILMVTAGVTAVLTALGSHMLPDTLVIIGVVLMNAILGFVQEGKAEGALDALRNMMVQQALVLRAGHQRRVAARDLVPGDIVLLESGDRIPADVRFLETSDLHVDEASLTGESIPSSKSVAKLDGSELVPGDQRNIGFSGTYVTRGTGRGIVVETGTQTVFGRIATLVKSADRGLTPLQKKMQVFVRTLIGAILAVGGFNFALGIYLGYEISYSFLGTVSLVVASIPEMLPALVTSILALSGTVMAGRKALIRKLPAAETLGATSVICSDKTGTLTENRMTVTRVYAGGQVFDVSGVGYEIEGEFSRDGTVAALAETPAPVRLLEVGFHCNNAHLGGESGTGDPTELALRISGAKAGIATDGVTRLVEIPFDSSAKYMAVLVDIGGIRYLFAKGAPERILAMCENSTAADGATMPLDNHTALETARNFARDALRTLGFAFKVMPKDCSGLVHSDLQGLTFAGLQGMIDPPRRAAIEAVACCKQAGIRTIMITGDHPDTAQAVAAQLGIDASEVLIGSELALLDEARYREAAERVSVFARVAPEHKKAIAEALQQCGYVVAMTGDGVNDAPALKAADIGVAMGITGTEVARESADMVLADDNFATIVAAVEEGRHAWNNLRKAILYTLPTNAAQAFLIMGAIMLASFMPLFSVRFVLEPVQILWVNLLDSVLLTMPLMMEQKERGLLQQPPRPANSEIIDGLFLQRVILLGFAISIPGFLVYYHFGASAVVEGQLVDPLQLTQAQTAAFWAILFAHFGYVVSARSVYKSAFKFSPFSNRWLLGGIVLSLAIRLIPTVVPQAAALFRTAEFPAEWWPIILACFFPSFIAIEGEKFSRRFFNARKAPPKQRVLNWQGEQS